MTATQIKVAIVGVTGYAGMELLRLIHAHPYVQVVSVHQTGSGAKFTQGECILYHELKLEVFR